MENQDKVIIIKTKTVKTEKSMFKSYKANINGKAIDLRFTKASNMNALKILDEEDDGYFRIVVSSLVESKTSFYPRYYATIEEVLGDDTEI